MYEKTPLAFEPNLKTSKAIHVAEHKTNILQRNLTFGVEKFAKRRVFLT